MVRYPNLTNIDASSDHVEIFHGKISTTRFLQEPPLMRKQPSFEYGIMNKLTKKHAAKYLPLFLIFVVLMVLNPSHAFADEPILPGTKDEDYEPNLPDLSHQFLAIHAAQSHGNSTLQINLISQGAYDEDHQLIPTFGWHSWDPDTGDFWWSPTGDGPALERANMLFGEAVGLFITDQNSAWMKFGQSLHLLQDLSTPAHAHADSHVCLAGIGDCDAYETWLGDDDLVNTWNWINDNPSGTQYNMRFQDIPEWEELTQDLISQLEGAHLEYGERESARDLWELGPVGIDPILFQLMFLMAESADNYNSGGLIEFPGEAFNGNLDDTAYLESMRDSLFPIAVTYSTAWIDYFERQVGIQDEWIFIPTIFK